jgi:hypothetical protein
MVEAEVKRMRLAALALLMSASLAAGTREDALLDAVRKSDAAAVKALLDEGVPVDTRFRYDRTALSFAADRGDVAIVKLLLDRGADPDAVDSFYHQSIAGFAARKGNVEVLRLLLARSTKSIGAALLGAIFGQKPESLDAVLATGRVSARDLSYALEAAEKFQAESGDMPARLRKAGAAPPPKADAVVDSATLARYAGRYRETNGTGELMLAVAEGALQLKAGERTFKLGAIDSRRFQNLEMVGVTYEIRLEGDRVVGATATEIGSEMEYVRVEDARR